MAVCWVQAACSPLVLQSCNDMGWAENRAYPSHGKLRNEFLMNLNNYTIAPLCYAELTGTILVNLLLMAVGKGNRFDERVLCRIHSLVKGLVNVLCGILIWPCSVRAACYTDWVTGFEMGFNCSEKFSSLWCSWAGVYQESTNILNQQISDDWRVQETLKQY